MTNLGYIFPLETILTMPYNKMIRIQTIVMKAAKSFIKALGGRKLVLESKGTPMTNSIGYEGMIPAYAVTNGLRENEEKIVISDPEVNHSIQLENTRRESLKNPNLSLQEEYFYLLQRSTTGGRRILTNLSGFRSHPLTRDLVKRTSQVVNCLKKMQPMKDSPEKRLLGMTVWRQIRTIISMVVVTNKTNVNKGKTIINNSRLSYWVTEDVARIAEFIQNSDMQSLLM